MTLRARLALALGLLAAVAVTVVAVAGYRATASRLSAQLDASLTSQSSRIADPDGRYARTVCQQISRAPGASADQDPGQVMDLTGTVVQCLDATGTPFASTESTLLPVSDADRRLAAAGTSAEAYTTTGGRRIVTIAVPGGGAVQLARDTDEVNDVLGSLRIRFTLLGIAVTIVAAAAGWLIARRVSRPIVTLTAATEQIAGSGALDADVPARTGTSETDRLARSFETMLDALRRSRATQQALVQDAGHELRTPLTALRTNIDVLRRHPDLPVGERAAVLGDVAAELRELTMLTDELIALAMADSDDEEPTRVDLADLAVRAGDRAQRRTGHPVRVDAQEAVVVGQPRLLLRALDNLLDNAAKFDSSEEAIEVAVRPGAVTVRDHGPGVAPSDQARIFDRFYRAPAARTRPGSGLGLAIVRDAAAAHDGTVTVANHPAGGAVFTIVLPVEEPPAGSESSQDVPRENLSTPSSALTLPRQPFPEP
jgi:two-component system, OmpR family, sensor histidine kinase MprB